MRILVRETGNVRMGETSGTVDDFLMTGVKMVADDLKRNLRVMKGDITPDMMVEGDVMSDKTSRTEADFQTDEMMTETGGMMMVGNFVVN